MTNSNKLDKNTQTIEDIFSAIPSLFIPRKNNEINGVYQVIFNDLNYHWYTIIEGHKCRAYQGVHEIPIVSMTLLSSDLIKIIYGDLNETYALMTKKMQLKGDIIKAIKYQGYFILKISKMRSRPYLQERSAFIGDLHYD